MTDPNADKRMMLDVALHDVLDDIEESRRRCLHSSPRLQDAILKAAAIVTKMQEMKNGKAAAKEDRLEVGEWVEQAISKQLSRRHIQRVKESCFTQELKNGHDGAADAKGDSPSEAARPADAYRL